MLGFVVRGACTGFGNGWVARGHGRQLCRAIFPNRRRFVNEGRSSCGGKPLPSPPRTAALGEGADLSSIHLSPISNYLVKKFPSPRGGRGRDGGKLVPVE